MLSDLGSYAVRSQIHEAVALSPTTSTGPDSASLEMSRGKQLMQRTQGLMIGRTSKTTNGPETVREGTPEVIPPLVCKAFRGTAFRSRRKNSKIIVQERHAGSTTNAEPGSNYNIMSETVKNHDHQSTQGPPWMLKSEYQAF